MKFQSFNNGTAMQSHRPCWTGTKWKVSTFLDESSLWTKPGLAHTKILKRQSNEWKHPGSPGAKKVRHTKCAAKVMFIVAYDIDIDRVILHHSVPPRQTVNAAYYCTFVQHHLRPTLRRKRRHRWYRIPSFFMTMQVDTPLLLSRTSCAAGNGRFWNIHHTHPI